jgi:hypothetical protein
MKNGTKTVTKAWQCKNSSLTQIQLTVVDAKDHLKIKSKKYTNIIQNIFI